MLRSDDSGGGWYNVMNGSCYHVALTFTCTRTLLASKHGLDIRFFVCLLACSRKHNTKSCLIVDERMRQQRHRPRMNVTTIPGNTRVKTRHQAELAEPKWMAWNARQNGDDSSSSPRLSEMGNSALSLAHFYGQWQGKRKKREKEWFREKNARILLL